MSSKQNSSTSRAFGRVLQQQPSISSKSNAISFLPNPNDRLWNPSPSKKLKTSNNKFESIISLATSSRRGSSSNDGGKENNSAATKHHNNKKLTTSRYFPTATTTQRISPIKHHDNQQPNRIISNVPQPFYFDENATNFTKIATTTTSSDLNTSFTEKISNLGIRSSSNNSNDNKVSNYNKPHRMPLLKLKEDDDEISITTDPYVTDILNHWHKQESRESVDPNYMRKQKEVSWKMRRILVDWLFEVVDEYAIGIGTMHRCVQYVDRFLSCLQTSRNNLQLLGIASLFIASKIEEIHPPDAADLIFITDNTYVKPQLLRMETLVLQTLNFNLLTPTPFEFMEYFASSLNLTQTAKEFSEYVLSLSLLEGKYLHFSSSVIGAGSVFVALRCCCYGSGDVDLLTVLRRIKRLNPNECFVKSVEDVVGLMFVMLLRSSTSNRNNSNEETSCNSVGNKYKKFQDQKYFVAAATAAACFSKPISGSVVDSCWGDDNSSNDSDLIII